VPHRIRFVAATAMTAAFAVPAAASAQEPKPAPEPTKGSIVIGHTKPAEDEPTKGTIVIGHTKPAEDEPTKGSIVISDGKAAPEPTKGTIVDVGKKSAPEPTKGSIALRDPRIIGQIVAKGGFPITEIKHPADPTKGWIVYMRPMDLADPARGMVTDLLPFALPAPPASGKRTLGFPADGLPEDSSNGGPTDDPADGDLEDRLREQQETMRRLHDILNRLNQQQQETTGRISG